jgi:hypothetical protein
MAVSAQAFPILKMQKLLDEFPSNPLTPYLRSFVELQKDLFSAAAKTASEGLVTSTLLARDVLVQQDWKTISHEDSTRGRLKSAALKDGVVLYDLVGEQRYWDKRAQRHLTSTLTQSASKVLQSGSTNKGSSSFRRDSRKDDGGKQQQPARQPPAHKEAPVQQSYRVGVSRVDSPYMSVLYASNRRFLAVCFLLCVWILLGPCYQHVPEVQ